MPARMRRDSSAYSACVLRQPSLGARRSAPPAPARGTRSSDWISSLSAPDGNGPASTTLACRSLQSPKATRLRSPQCASCPPLSGRSAAPPGPPPPPPPPRGGGGRPRQGGGGRPPPRRPPPPLGARQRQRRRGRGKRQQLARRRRSQRRRQRPRGGQRPERSSAPAPATA